MIPQRNNTRHESVRLNVGGVPLDGDLGVPANAAGLVLFAHGSGSSRFSRRNRSVARALEADGFATLLLDLLTSSEEMVDERNRQHRFDIGLLGRRVIGALDWARERPDLRPLPLSVFGASTGAAAALVAAARRPAGVGAVVSRGGRPVLAGDLLPRVQAPTLLIVGGRDDVVLGLNRQAYRQLTVERRLDVIPGATHLFEEPGALDSVVRLAGDWFDSHLRRPAAGPPATG